ncbi:hypothetical protein D3C78_1299950 [compost metagenome]
MEVFGTGVVDVVYGIPQVSDRRGITRDIGGVGRHLIVGRFQLRTVHRIGAGIAQLTGSHIGDLGRAITHMVGTVRPVTAIRRGIPLQRIVLQPIDVGGVVGDVCSVTRDIGGIGRHLSVGVIQL